MVQKSYGSLMNPWENYTDFFAKNFSVNKTVTIQKHFRKNRLV